MSEARFPTQVLRRLAPTLELLIETRRRTGAPAHRTIIWIVTRDGRAFIRSVRGVKGRWYQEALANPSVALLAGTSRIQARAIKETDPTAIAWVSDAYRRKYGRRWRASTAAMVRPGVLDTTLRLVPAGR